MHVAAPLQQILLTSLVLIAHVAVSAAAGPTQSLLPASAAAKIPRTLAPLPLVQRSRGVVRPRERKERLDDIVMVAAGEGQVTKQNGLQRAVNAYSNALEQRPLFTKVWSAAVVSAVGNVLAQAIAADAPLWAFHIDDLNIEEMLIYTAVGAFYFAPLTHFWFSKLAEIIGNSSRLKGAGDMTKAVAMMAVDQTVGAVAVNAGFLLLYGIIDRMRDMDLVINEPPAVTILRRVKKQLWPLLLMNWCVWPAANLVNFYAVPYRYRVLYTNVVGALWSVYLSTVVSTAK